MMKNLNLSSNFNLDDIRKIRDYEYEKTKDMTFQERVEYNRKINEEGRKILEEWKQKFGTIKKHR